VSSVDEVAGVKVTGANIMVGTYPDGSEEVHVYTVAGATPDGVGCDAASGLLPVWAMEAER
jgi:hypothetical protein